MKTVLIFFGPPGSGKGTQSDMIAARVGLPIISTGELLRHEIKMKTKTGKKVEKEIAKGKYVSDDVIENIIFKRIKNKDTKKGYVFDGFPRGKKQLDHLIKILQLDHPRVIAILIDVSDKEVKSRLGGRRVCDCGASYHIKFNPPKKKSVCDLCGSRLTTRTDDKQSVIIDRLKLYRRKIYPLLKYWEKENKLIKINGEQAIRQVQKDIIKALEKEKII